MGSGSGSGSGSTSGSSSRLDPAIGGDIGDQCAAGGGWGENDGRDGDDRGGKGGGPLGAGRESGWDRDAGGDDGRG
jgi:hypothetical protein